MFIGDGVHVIWIRNYTLATLKLEERRIVLINFFLFAHIITIWQLGSSDTFGRGISLELHIVDISCDFETLSGSHQDFADFSWIVAALIYLFALKASVIWTHLWVLSVQSVSSHWALIAIFILLMVVRWIGSDCDVYCCVLQLPSESLLAIFWKFLSKELDFLRKWASMDVCS